jgi:hypothetical protein
MSRQEFPTDVCEHGIMPPGAVVSMAGQMAGLGFSVGEGAVLSRLAEVGRVGIERADPLLSALNAHADGGSDTAFAQAVIGSYET